MHSGEATRRTIGWDIGGAHLKGACVDRGVLSDVAQWRCELWRGLSQLEEAFAAAHARWSDIATCAHAVTMTGELADVFEHREAGVAAIATAAVRVLGPDVGFYAGEDGFVDAGAAHTCWHAIASANWLATASVVAGRLSDAVVIDIGSTTTDVVPIAGGRIVARGRDDVARLAARELVYVGVVRTPLCALAQRVPFRGRAFNVMNELFATSGDVFRLTGELAPAHDQAATADGAPRDLPSTRRRLARMIGCDARDATDDQWLAFAREWRSSIAALVRENAEHAIAAAGVPPDAPVVGAGCGSFLARECAAGLKRRYVEFASVVAAPSACRDGAGLCAPAAAVAILRASGA
jgi:probable H4MPT-linked C1 transfer pathway protein